MTTQTLYSALTYIDAPAAIAFLERAFGLTPENVYPGEAGAIAHAQLRAGNELVMLGSAGPSKTSFGALTSPQGLGGRGTIALYVYVSDVESVFAKTRAADAEIVRTLGGTDYDDSQMFTAKDCEGYLWSFGTYASQIGASISPCLRYEDPKGAIAWLRDTCGFTEKMVVPDDNGGVSHSELSLGTSVLMLGSRRDDDLTFDTPARAGGTSGSVYAYVAEPDALFESIRKTKTEIVIPIDDKDYGSREFSVRDPEGNAFSFGTYRP